MAAPSIRHHHVAFRVADLEASIRWYAAAFGAREALRVRWDDGTTRLAFVEYAPGHFLELFPDGQARAEEPADPIGYRHLAVVVEDLGAALDHLARTGVTPRRAPATVRVRPAGATASPTTYVSDTEGTALARIAFVADPDGNQIELVEVPPHSPLAV
jgi:catechol 2,3-dioxygenase-like lactoylglutathione lyase family enzyme